MELDNLVRFSARARDFPVLHSVKTESGVHPGAEADHSPPSSAEAKNDGAVPPFSVCLHDTVINFIIKEKDNFTLPSKCYSLIYFSVFQVTACQELSLPKLRTVYPRYETDVEGQFHYPRYSWGWCLYNFGIPIVICRICMQWLKYAHNI
jgi:hypothetical protein